GVAVMSVSLPRPPGAPGGRAYRRDSRGSTCSACVDPKRSARPPIHGVCGRRYDERACRLVVPRLLLVIPEHPEVAEVARDLGDDADEIANERAAVVDAPSRRGVD